MRKARYWVPAALLLLVGHAYAQEVLLAKGGWALFSSMPVHLRNSASGALEFTVPDASRGTVDYFFTKSVYDVSERVSLIADIRITAISGDPVFVYDTTYNPCVFSPHVRLFLWRYDRIPERYNDEFGRWWSNPLSQELTVSTFTLQTALDDPGQWSSVYGKFATESPEALAGFETVKAAAHLGMTFGGGCYFGHGVSTVGGEAVFNLKSFRVE